MPPDIYETDEFGIYAEEHDPRGCGIVIALTAAFWIAAAVGVWRAWS